MAVFVPGYCVDCHIAPDVEFHGHAKAVAHTVDAFKSLPKWHHFLVYANHFGSKRETFRVFNVFRSMSEADRFFSSTGQLEKVLGREGVSDVRCALGENSCNSAICVPEYSNVCADNSACARRNTPAPYIYDVELRCRCKPGENAKVAQTLVEAAKREKTFPNFLTFQAMSGDAGISRVIFPYDEISGAGRSAESGMKMLGNREVGQAYQKFAELIDACHCDVLTYLPEVSNPPPVLN